VFDRFPDVKVIRLSPQSGIGFLYTAEREEGIEVEALIRFQALLEKNGLDTNPLRLFGWMWVEQVANNHSATNWSLSAAGLSSLAQKTPTFTLLNCLEGFMR
jgi:hypothetical protein